MGLWGRLVAVVGRLHHNPALTLNMTDWRFSHYLTLIEKTTAPGLDVGYQMIGFPGNLPDPHSQAKK
jgi:hypothetical protein